VTPPDDRGWIDEETMGRLLQSRTALRRRVVTGLIIATALIVAGNMWLFRGIGPSYWVHTIFWGNTPFDQAVWVAEGADGEPAYDSVRGRMVRSLLRNHRLVGMTRHEALLLLGTPDELNWSQSYPKPEPDDEGALEAAEDYCYVVGSYSGFRIDYDSLIVEFNDAGRVRGWGIGQN